MIRLKITSNGFVVRIKSLRLSFSGFIFFELSLGLFSGACKSYFPWSSVLRVRPTQIQDRLQRHLVVTISPQRLPQTPSPHSLVRSRWRIPLEEIQVFASIFASFRFCSYSISIFCLLLLLPFPFIVFVHSLSSSLPITKWALS